ncbi:MAG: uroporphyrinogen-III synthase [Tahibacter sp.]
MRKRIQPMTRARDLRGASVIVTRPSATAAPLLRGARRLGADTVRLPGIALRPVEDAAGARRALIQAQTADLVIFVSPAAVRFAWTLRPGLRFAARVGVAAVGAATAQALRRRGVHGVIAPEDGHDSDALLANADLRAVRGKRVVVIGAPEGRDRLAAGLRRRGAALTELHVYARAAPRWDQRHFARLDTAPKPRLLLVSSAFALANLAARLPPGLVVALREAELVVSSLRLAMLAREHGFQHVHVARSALGRDLLDAAIGALSRHRL